MKPYANNMDTEETPEDKQDGKMGGGKGTEVCVPINSLQRPGEDEQMMNPAEGDVVSLYAEGKVTRIEGDMVYVKVDSVNGKPLDEATAKKTNNPEASEDSDKDFEQLKTEAAQMPGM